MPSRKCLLAGLIAQVKNLLSNPFALGCIVVAVVGYINDPTTQGIADSKQALLYQKPKKDSGDTYGKQRDSSTHK